MWHNTLLSAVRITRYKSLHGIRINARPFTLRLLTHQCVTHTHTRFLFLLCAFVTKYLQVRILFLDFILHAFLPGCAQGYIFLVFVSANTLWQYKQTMFTEGCLSAILWSNCIGRLPQQSMRRLTEKTWYAKCVLARIGGFTYSILHLDSHSQRLPCLWLHPMNIWGSPEQRGQGKP